MATKSATPNIIYTKQSSFANGEVSSDMWGRDDYAKYFVSAKTMENFIPLPYGGAQNRPGTMFVAEVKDSSKKVKLLPFQFSVEQAYVIEAGEHYFRYIKDGGQIIDPGTSEIIETTTTYDEEYLFNLKTAQSADTMYICNSKYVPKTLTRSSHYNWSLNNFDFKGGPFRDQNTTTTKLTPSATTGTITVTSSSGVFTANMVGGLLAISHDIYGQSAHYSGGSPNTTAAIKVNGDWSFQITDPYEATFTIQISNDNGATWETLKTYSCTDASSAIQDSGTIDHYALLRIDSTQSINGSGSYTLSSTAFINNGYVTITAYTNSTTVIATVYENGNKYIWGIASTKATADWSIGAWNNEYGYPACVKFYQNRLGFAGSTKDPLTLWLSQTGDYISFIVNTPVEDSDSITAPLVSEGVNSIRSMVSIGNMIAFTAGGTWKIGTGSESAAFTPTTARALQQGYIGVSTLSPIIVGSRILYCQEMGSTVRDISYQLADDVYKGDDMTMLARHLFKNHNIVDWAFQQEPDGIIWAVREDGVLLSFTYNKEQDVYAWARHITDGEYESVAAIPGNGYTEIYFVIRREINGVYKRYIERLVPRMVSTDPRDQFFVDCGLTLDNPIAITGATKANPVVITAVAHGLVNGNYVDISDIKGMTELNGMRYKVANKTTDTFQLVNMDTDTNIDGTSYTAYKSSGHVRKCVLAVSGLSHLEGETVTILADGSVNTQQVVTGGSITLDDYASRVHVGLGYECNLETLNIDFPMSDGTIQGRTKAIRGVTVRVENTYGGFVGINGDDKLEIIEQTLSETWGKPAELVTGDKKVSPCTEYNTDATVYIRQSDPLPMTVLAIMSEVEIGG